jgi:drug/metabolite transporter (DMT)-like permease
MPLMTLMLAHFFSDDERLTRYKIGGILMGLIGVITLFGFEKLFSLGEQAIRQYAILGAAACYAVNVLIMKKLTAWPRYALIAAVLIMSLLSILPFALIQDLPWTLDPRLRSIIATVLLCVLSSGGGSLLRFAIVERQGAGFISQINYLIPLMAVFWTWLFLQEVPEMRAYIALAFIFAGMAIVRLGLRRDLFASLPQAGLQGKV